MSDDPVALIEPGRDARDGKLADRGARRPGRETTESWLADGLERRIELVLWDITQIAKAIVN